MVSGALHMVSGTLLMVSGTLYICALYPTFISQVFLAYKEKFWDLKIPPAATKQPHSRTGIREWLGDRVSLFLLCCDDKGSCKRKGESGLHANVHHTVGIFNLSPDQKYERRPHALKHESKNQISVQL